jgi:hypothetical protein
MAGAVSAGTLRLRMYKIGELIKRKTLSDGISRPVCIIVQEDIDNYTLYNCSRMSMQTVAKCIVRGLYTPVDNSGS